MRTVRRRDKWPCLYWLNLYELAKRLLQPNEVLVTVRYFTAIISSPPSPADKQRRQTTYLEALGTLANVSIHYGVYSTMDRRCPHCNQIAVVPKEKMTDVKIAVELMTDAFTDAFDTAILVSGDSDLVPPVQAVIALFPEKHVVLASPPARVSKALRQTAHEHRRIRRAHLEQSQFPPQVARADGFTLSRPSEEPV